jgi:hypothetical protein
MRQPGDLWQTIVTGTLIGALLSGCGAMTGTSLVGAGSGNRPGSGASPCPNNPAFPECQLWCWSGPGPGNTDQKELLGHIIMVERNPYCTSPASNPPGNQFDPNPDCDPATPATWPKQLTNPTAWKILTEFDFRPAQDWPVGQGQVVRMARIMRVPYLIGHSVARHNRSEVTTLAGSGAVPRSLGRENLLIGYARTSEPLSGRHDWNAVSSCPGGAKGDSLGQLAEFIVINMMADGDSQPGYVDNWQNIVQPNLASSVWSFRGANVSVDYSFSFPVATVDSSNRSAYGRIYVGYEGGGAY